MSCRSHRVTHPFTALLHTCVRPRGTSRERRSKGICLGKHTVLQSLWEQGLEITWAMGDRGTMNLTSLDNNGCLLGSS